MSAKNPVYVIGHRNPDTDSICSAIAYARLKEALGTKAQAARAGEVNPETKYALDTFKAEAPQFLAQVAAQPEKVQIILVDHNEPTQAVEGIDNAQILEVIDHHRLGGLTTVEPLYVRVEPVGCTATVVTKMYEENGVAIPAGTAGLLLSAIISDTVLFKSPTTTERERATAEKLAKIAGVDVQKYGLEMLKAGSSIGGMATEAIAKNDSKEFKVGAHRVLIGQISVMDMGEVNERKAAILAAMEKVAADGGYSLVVLMATDIIAEATDLFYVGEPKSLIAEAFKGGADGNSVYLPGVMSRKKQVVPPLLDAAKKLGL